VLLIGASGQLGQALSAVFRDHDVVPAAYRHAEPGQRIVDLGEPVSVRLALEATKPDLVLIAGGETHVDGCEADADRCVRVNVRSTQLIAEHARGRGARVVYYSTDYVFDGAARAYVETDPVSPVNVYGRSKAEAEAVLREILPDRHLVLRTSWVYGPDRQRRNFALRVIDVLSQPGEPLRVPCDQYGSPTFTEDLARATYALVERDAGGTFHAAGPEFVDRATLALTICERFGLDGRRIVPTPTSSLGQTARRPLRGRLDCQKLGGTGVAAFRGIDAGLRSLPAVSLRSSASATER
jgi:dTDP-4-dehydrorhamnose reductase